MKDQLLNKLAAHQDELIKILNKCPEYGEREDLLQDWYMFIYEKDFPSFSIDNMFKGGELNTGFVYVTMKNFTLDKIRKVATRDQKIQDSYRTHYEVTESLEDSISQHLSYEANMDLLKDLTSGIKKKDYKDILKLLSGNLLSDFRKNGDVDMKAYQARRYQLSKVIDVLKKSSEEYNYLFPDDISLLTTYEDLNKTNSKK